MFTGLYFYYRPGSIIVQYAVVTSNDKFVSQSMSRAFVNMEKLAVFGQECPVASKKIDDTEGNACTVNLKVK